MLSTLFKRILPVTLILVIPLFLKTLVAQSIANNSPTTITAIPDATADRVLGQSGFTTNSQPSNPTATVLNGPAGVAIRPGGRLFVVDYNHNRVLSWPNAATFSSGGAADLVLGQSNLTSMVGQTTQSGLNAPESIAIDGAGNVWVADSYNQRVLRYSAPLTSKGLRPS
jgi:DNA-binding beta-propeller fold protein YncE